MYLPTFLSASWNSLATAGGGRCLAPAGRPPWAIADINLACAGGVDGMVLGLGGSYPAVVLHVTPWLRSHSWGRRPCDRQSGGVTSGLPTTDQLLLPLQHVQGLVTCRLVTGL